MQRIFLHTVDSTMAAMDRLLKYSHLPEGAVISAAYQHMGRGMEDNYWESQEGCNLLATFVLYPVFLHPSRQFLINCCVSLAVRDLVQNQLPQANVKVKWPNDIYIEKEKVAGLLIRHDITGDKIDTTYIGVGLNVNQQVFRSQAPNPVSLIQVDGLYRSVDLLIGILQKKLMAYYEALKAGQYVDLMAKYKAQLFQLGISAHYIIHQNQTEAVITDVDEYGHLVLKTTEGKMLRCDMKEIKFL